MSEVVERVARAIYETKTGSEFVGAGAGPEHDQAFELARAAIIAMRAPTVHMLLRGQHAQVSAIRESHVEGVSVDLLSKLAAVDPDHLRRAYRAMIDAALSAPTASPADRQGQVPGTPPSP